MFRKGSIKQGVVKFMAYLSIGLIFMLLANHAINTHMHVLENGFVITHAHPYDKASDNELPKKHKHTQEELLFFSALSLFFAALLLIIAWKVREFISHSFIFQNQHYSITVSSRNSGRSPPF